MAPKPPSKKKSTSTPKRSKTQAKPASNSESKSAKTTGKKSSAKGSTKKLAKTPTTAAPVKGSAKKLAKTPIAAAPVKGSAKKLAKTPTAAAPVKGSAKKMAKTSAAAAPAKGSAKKLAKNPTAVAPAKYKTGEVTSVQNPLVARDPKALPPARRPSVYHSQQILAPSADAPLSEEQLRKIKSGLTRKDIEQYAAQLWQKRKEILGVVESLQSDRDAKNSGGDLSNMPLHMADVGSDNYEQEFTLHLVESERKLLQEINEALLRIKKGIYGVCVESGRPIAKARLDAKPWAQYCIEVAREKERQGRM